MCKFDKTVIKDLYWVPSLKKKYDWETLDYKL
jgi:hypothetical protein